MVSFIGAGPGDPELLTIKGKKIIDSADVIIYAGSLVNPQVLADAKEGAVIYNSALMNLDEVIDVMKDAEDKGPPLTSFILSIEMFGAGSMKFVIICVAISYMLSGYYSLYNSQKIVYSKYKTEYINRHSH